MRYSGIQPQYFPRLHYFARILNADVFVIRDDVKYVRKHKYPDGKVGKSFQSHTPIKQSFGTHILAVPVKHNSLPLLETEVSYDQNWVENHLKTLQFAYNKSPHFKTIYPEIEEILSTHHSNLVELNNTTILWGIARLLGEEIVRLKDLTIAKANAKLKIQNLFRLKEIRRATKTKAYRQFKGFGPNEKIIALCQEIGANEDYCGGTGAAAYMDEEIFKKNGINVVVQDWKYEEHPQLFIKQVGFIPNLSIIDLLMNTTGEEAAKIIAPSN